MRGESAISGNQRLRNITVPIRHIIRSTAGHAGKDGNIMRSGHLAKPVNGGAGLQWFGKHADIVETGP